jgi:hypothetical protein
MLFPTSVPTSTAGDGNPFPDIEPGITEVLVLKE